MKFQNCEKIPAVMVLLRSKKVKGSRENTDFPATGFAVENLWEALFNSPQERVLVVNSEGLVDRISPSLAAAVGRKPEELIGLPLRYNLRCFRRIDRVIKSGDAEFGIVETIGTENVLVDYIVVKNNGKVAGVIARVKLPANEWGGMAVFRIPDKTSVKGHAVRFSSKDIIGTSHQMADLKNILLRVALRDSNILITGESGTGKELFAQAIHAASLRKEGPFVKINCAAIPESLLESELFGYEEGTFTGSRKGGRKGKLEIADRGTVLLDEIGALSFSLQAKLLRFIQDGEIQKLGGTGSIKSNARIIAATNVETGQLVKEGSFREDLFFRLNVVNINIPPLRERKEDIVLLAQHFIEKFNRIFKFRVLGLSAKTEEILRRYNWPGNVRELENVIERAFNILEGSIILPQHLPAELINAGQAREDAADRGQVEFIAKALSCGQNMGQILAGAERTVILQALSICRGNKAKASKLLGISRPGLYKKMVKLNIE